MTITLRRVGEKGDFAPMAQAVALREHHLIADGTLPEGGKDMGPSPHDLYDAALGACKALTVLWYARRKGMPVEDIQTSVERDDSGERAGVYRLATRLKISGNLSDEQLRELETVAGKCPVHKLMTSVTTEVSTVVERLP
jgi:putative redox protein